MTLTSEPSVGTIRVKRPAGFSGNSASPDLDFQIECLFIGVAYSENRAQGTLTANEAEELSCGRDRIRIPADLLPWPHRETGRAARIVAREPNSRPRSGNRLLSLAMVWTKAMSFLSIKARTYCRANFCSAGIAFG